MQKLR